MSGEAATAIGTEQNETGSSSRRKREREISQEPPTPTLDVRNIGDDSDTGANGVGNTPSRRSKRRSPKKNRVGTPRRELDDTKEEETGDDGDNPPVSFAPNGDRDRDEMVISVSGSPPHETKMRQISEGVGGMKVKRVGTLEGDGVVPVPVPAPGVDDQQQPFPCADDGGEITGLRASSSLLADDMDQDKMLKRKLGDRAVSESREAESLGNKTSRKDVAHVAPTTPMGPKRSREDDDKEENPRENKRPSPPPEKDVQTVAEPSSSKPKSTGFMAYAGSSSPFASAKGPSVFKSTTTTNEPTTTTNESTKRPRDDANEDVNPREQKRPSPPPDQEKAADPGTTTSKGFLAFASTSSPFANVKGPNLFSKNASGTGTSSPWSTSTSPSPTIASPKPTGFEGFASPSSPFGRSKSPMGALGRSRSPSSRKPPSGGVSKNSSSAFSAYAGQGFSLRAAAAAGGKRARAVDDGAEEGRRKRNSVDGPGRSDEDTEGSEEREKEKEKMSFGDRLRTEGDGQGSGDEEDGKVVLTEQELHTGEEDEETIYQVRGKLFALGDQNQWRERGTGIIKLNLRRSDGNGARLLMRKDAVYTVILNAPLFKGMKCSYAQDQRYLRFSTFENGAATHYNLRLANAKMAEGLLEEVNAHIPMN